MATFPPDRRRARQRLWLVVLCLLGGGIFSPPGHGAEGLPPVSTAELCLLLRGGSTGAEVLSDTAGRPLLGPLDTAAEKLLRDAGADAALITALRRSHTVATAAQAEAERARQDDLARQRLEAWESNQGRLREASQAALAATLDARAREAQQNIARLLHGKLVVYRDQRLQTFDDSRLPEKTQFAFYFAALAEPACRKVSAQLVKFYEQYAPTHPGFELVFVSKDYSSFEMESNVRAYVMPWPVLDYPQLSEEKELTQMGAGSLPRLLVVNGAGRLLLDSRAIGLSQVLTALNENPGVAVATASP